MKILLPLLFAAALCTAVAQETQREASARINAQVALERAEDAEAAVNELRAELARNKQEAKIKAAEEREQATIDAYDPMAQVRRGEKPSCPILLSPADMRTFEVNNALILKYGAAVDAYNAAHATVTSTPSPESSTNSTSHAATQAQLDRDYETMFPEKSAAAQ